MGLYLVSPPGFELAIRRRIPSPGQIRPPPFAEVQRKWNLREGRYSADSGLPVSRKSELHRKWSVSSYFN